MIVTDAAARGLGAVTRFLGAGADLDEVGSLGGIRMSIQQAPWTIETMTLIEQVETASSTAYSGSPRMVTELTEPGPPRLWPSPRRAFFT